MATATKKSLFEVEAEKAREVLRGMSPQIANEDIIERGGNKLRLPERLSIDDGIDVLERAKLDQQQEALTRRVFKYRPRDGFHATLQALKRAFGGVTTPQQMGFFGPTPPRFLDVEVDFGKTVQCPIDSVVVPYLPEVEFFLGGEMDEELGEVFVVTASGPKGCAAEVNSIMDLIEEELIKNSIYRGKAIHDGFGFLNISKVDPDKVVYSEVTWGELETNIFARLRYPEALRAHGVDLKGAVLLEGTYGTGKTLAAYLTAQEAVKAGWGFILVRPEHVAQRGGLDLFRQAMQTAELYEPTVVFVEDVDTLASADSESDRISTMLDIFDGARSKGREVLVVLTTNHAESIHKGMVRPGRIDAVITIPPPDAGAIVKLCKVLVPEELLSASISEDEWETISAAMEGFIPAFVAEACSRAVRYLLVRTQGNPTSEEKIGAEDLRRAAEGLQAQLDLMNGAKDVPEREALAGAFQYALRPAIEEAVIQLVPESLREELVPQVLKRG